MKNLPLRTINLRGKEYSYTVRRSARAKHILLHVSVERGIEVVVPRWAAYAAGEKFLASKLSWLQRALLHYEQRRSRMPSRSLTSGATVPAFGQPYTLAVHRDLLLRRARLVVEGRVLHLHVRTQAQVRPLLVQWYRRTARQYFAGTTHALAEKLGCQIARIRIGEQRTQWGSCSSRGVLSLNWRLALAPEAVARYVAAHEVAHLKHRHHSRTFWQCVAQLYPAYTTHRVWLKEHGHTLVL